MNRKELVSEIIELLEIPQIESILRNKVKELQILFADDIAHHKNIKQDICEGLEKMKVSEEEGEVHGTKYNFELYRNGEGKWIPYNVDPPIPYHSEPRTIIPPAAIKLIGTYPPNPEKIEKIKGFTDPSLEGRIYDLSFTRYNHHQAIVSICEINKFDTGDPENGNKNSAIRLDATMPDIPDFLKFKEYFFYMEKYAIFKQHILSEFYFKWKPFLDNNLIVGVSTE